VRDGVRKEMQMDKGGGTIKGKELNDFYEEGKGKQRNDEITRLNNMGCRRDQYQIKTRQ
jgi:hypothetical protein